MFQGGKEEKRKHSAERAKKNKKVLDKLPKVWYNEYVPKRDKKKIKVATYR